MKKRMFVSFLLLTVCLFHFSIPNIVFGQSLGELGLGGYRETFKHPDVHDDFPAVLNVFKSEDAQVALHPIIISNFANDPKSIRAFVRDVNNSVVVDDSILVLLTIDDENYGFKALFRDPAFHAVLQDPDKIDKLVEAIKGLIPDTRDSTCPILPPPPEPDPPKATTLSIVSGFGQEGSPGERLLRPFVVEVRDQYGKVLPQVSVGFRVTEGNGTILSTVPTNNRGQASTILTLGGTAGANWVEARVAGIRLAQTFTATAIAPPPPPPPPGESPLPPMYWIEGNSIYYRPTGGGKEIFWEPKGGILTGGLAVDTMERRVYWTEQTSDTTGRIRSITLGDKRVKEVVELKKEDGVPNGITVGTDRKEERWIYWTTSQGKIQRIKIGNTGIVAPSSFEGNLGKGLDSPRHIAFDAEQQYLYWTEPGRIKSVYPNGNGRKLVAENLGDLGGIAVSNGTVYWTERTGTGPGTLQGAVKSVNRDGSSGKLLAGLESIPEGIAVDAVGGKVYWTTSRGYIQSAPLTGIIKPVVEGNDTRAVGLAVVSSSMDKMGAAPSAAAPSISPVVSAENTLLANYPNPFNPETWIPYQLSTSADVSVLIYSVNGHLVRRLELGHQSAGVYRSRSRAAYWDGRNEFGERVASGLYFYTLTAGDFTATRKMLIRK